MAWGARIMAVRGLDERGNGFTSNLAKGIQYAIDNGADVINNSWAGGRSQAIDDVVAAAASQGVVVVFAAGNENSGYAGTAGAPDVIAVAATQYDDSRAPFSNYGPHVSVAAPGVQFCRPEGRTVSAARKSAESTGCCREPAWRRRTSPGSLPCSSPRNRASRSTRSAGTSSSTPTNPAGQATKGSGFNPYFGCGRINAARVFDAPPATTRMTTPATTFHALEGTTRPQALSLDFTFTTHEPVDWSISGPTWLVPEAATGTGGATVPCTLDATAIGAGSYSGTLAVAAPTTVDGGGSVSVATHVHHDGRAGTSYVLSEAPLIQADAPAIASDGQGTLFAWVPWPTSGLLDLVAAYVASDGTVTGPFTIDPGFCESDLCQLKHGSQVAAVFDGSAFLVAWEEEVQEHPYPYNGNPRRHDLVKAVRVSAAGQVLGPPVTLAENIETAAPDNSYDEYFFNLRVAADGAGSIVLWGQIDWSQPYPRAFRYWTRRVDLSGNAPAARQQFYPAADTTDPQFIEPRIACMPADGTCLVAWHEADGEMFNGRYVDKIVGKRFVADVALDAVPRRILRDGENMAGLVSGNGQFLATSYRVTACVAGQCNQAVAARFATDGTALDPDGVVLNNAGPDGSGRLEGPIGAAFDGSNYWVTWGEIAALTAPPTCYPFAARLGATGGVLDSEPSGLLLTASPIPCSAARSPGFRQPLVTQLDRIPRSHRRPARRGAVGRTRPDADPPEVHRGPIDRAWHELSIGWRVSSSANGPAGLESAHLARVPHAAGRRRKTMATLDRYPEPLEATQWDRDQRFETTFAWEYDDGRDKLLNLYRKGKKLQWDAAERIDWSQDLDPENPVGPPRRGDPDLRLRRLAAA